MNKKNKNDSTVGVTLVTFIMAAIAIMILPNTTDNLEAYYYASQIIAAVFIVVAGLAALWQYRVTSKNNQINVSDLRVQRAIDLTEYYKDNILHYYPALWFVFDRCGLLEDFEKVPLSKMVSFDDEELKRVFSDKQVEKFKAAQEKPAFINAVIEADEIYNLGLNMDKEINTIMKEDGTKEIKISANATKAVIAFMTEVKNTMLNNMEYFAMAFTHNTADESVVYQSLHQNYFDACRLLYYFIASQNTSTTDKYYTNVIKLFRKWYKRSVDQEKKRKLLASNSVHSGTIVD